MHRSLRLGISLELADGPHSSNEDINTRSGGVQTSRSAGRRFARNRAYGLPVDTSVVIFCPGTEFFPRGSKPPPVKSAVGGDRHGWSIVHGAKVGPLY